MHICLLDTRIVYHAAKLREIETHDTCNSWGHTTRKERKGGGEKN